MSAVSAAGGCAQLQMGQVADAEWGRSCRMNLLVSYWCGVAYNGRECTEVEVWRGELRGVLIGFLLAHSGGGSGSALPKAQPNLCCLSSVPRSLLSIRRSLKWTRTPRKC